MRKLFTLLLIALTAFSLEGMAQTKKGKITGSVIDGSQKTIESATITLLRAKDSSVAKISVADKTGKFEFENLPEGKYLVSITAVGHQPGYSEQVEVTSELTDVTVKTIELVPLAKSVGGVVVSAKKPPVEVKAGKTIVNVEASPTNAGLNVMEILEKSPGVSVDDDGNISIKGKSGVLILIDGKQTYLSGTQLSSFLKSIQAGNLNQIEIMTTPPAKYDAAGNAGIINIITKKGTIKGMNGSIDMNYAQGLYPKYNGGANFNYRNNKINLFGNYNGGVWEGWGILKINRKFSKDGVSTGTSDQQTERHNKGNWNNAKLGLDYNFSKKDIAGIVLTGNLNRWKNWQESTSNLRDPGGDINSVFLSDAYNGSRSGNVNTNFNYKHSFDSTGKELTADLDYGYYENKGKNLLNTEVYNAANVKQGNTVLLQGDFPSIIKIYSGKVDYVHPFSKNLKLETGLKSAFVNTDNDVFYVRDTSTGWYTDKQRTNHFIYKENVNAVYATLSATIKKWELTGGLRMENTIAKGTQLQNDSSFKRNYTNLFPSAGAVYNMNDKNQFSVAYSRRVRRPNYDDLNPFVFFLDSLTYGQGNPYLQPEFSNRGELSHTYKHFLTTTVSYTQTDNIITQLLKQNTEKKTTFQTTENFARRQQVGLSVSANQRLAKWWNMNVYAGVFNNTYKGIYNDGVTNTPVKVNVAMFTANLSNSFSFAKIYSAEVSGWYNSNPSDGLIIGRSMGAVNSAIAMQIMKKKGTVKLGVRDIFRTSNFSGYSKYADVDITVNNNRKRDSRQVSLSFSYKFGKNNIAPARRRTGGAGDEQDRVKSGGN
jgi:outer membrane receptor protein involved in Fe transport